MSETGKSLTVKGLEACGWVKDENARTSKYMVYRKSSQCDVVYFVGHGGALRIGKLGRPVLESRSLTGTKRHEAIQEVGRRAKGYSSAEQAEKDWQYLTTGILPAPLDAS
jgi:hypothetical protein